MINQKILLKSFGSAENVTQLKYQINIIDIDQKINILRGIKNTIY